MRTIRILHLFPKLLSLYGEYGNIAVLRKMLIDNGFRVELEEYENGEPDLDGADFVYAGSGTEDNLIEAASRLWPVRSRISESVGSNTVWLATGNAMTVFGRSIKVCGADFRAAELFGYETELSYELRFSGDVIAQNPEIVCCPAVGYINTSSVYRDVESPLFELIFNSRLGNDKSSAGDGILINKFFGTQLIGPVLAKNPEFLKRIYFEVTGERLELEQDSDIVMAYKSALDGLQKRV